MSRPPDGQALIARAAILAEIPLSEDEQRAMMVIWHGMAIGICPNFTGPRTARLRQGADQLVARGLCYRTTGELEPDQRKDEAGYSLKSEQAEMMAEVLVDASGLDLHELLDEEDYTPTPEEDDGDQR